MYSPLGINYFPKTCQFYIQLFVLNTLLFPTLQRSRIACQKSFCPENTSMLLNNIQVYTCIYTHKRCFEAGAVCTEAKHNNSNSGTDSIN